MQILRITAAFLITLTLASCSSTVHINTDSTPQTLDVFAMDTYMSMKAYGENAQTALEHSKKLILQLESELSTTDGHSCIAMLNGMGSGQVTESAADIIEKAIDIGRATDGALDITIYPLLKEWGFTTGEYKVPDKTVIEKLLGNTGAERVVLDGKNVTLPEDVQIDLGSLAKGYTSDRIVSQMKSDGVKSAVVSLGGNVQALGSKPDGSAWKVSVRDPFAPDTDMCIVEVRDKAVITSGNYERFFTDENDNKYWHILDPADGYPADNGLVSVTVIGDSGIDCDALSTAFFVMGTEKTADLLKSSPEFDVILCTDDGHILYTEGIADSFTNISSMETEVLSLD